MNRRTYFLAAILLPAWLSASAQAGTIMPAGRTLADEVDSLMSVHYPPDLPGAAVVLIKNNEPVFTGGYGMANLETGQAITPETIFRIGSMTKQFTAVGLLMLVHDGKLSLQDRVQDFYPDLFGSHPDISIRHLLSHTSGITELSGIPAVRPLLMKQTPVDSIIAILSREALDFTPGSRYSYSNSGYVVLGGILQKAAQQDYGSFLRERIFDPLGMKHSFFANSGEIDLPRAKGYFTRPDHYVEAPDINSSLLISAGGIWSNAGDMALWNRSLTTGRLLDRKYIEMAHTPQTLNDGRQTDYGFGFRRCMVNGEPSIEHGGGVFGFKSYGIRMEQQGIYVLILSNFERENPYDELAAEIAAMAAGKPYRHRFVDLPGAILEEYIGTYLTEDGDTLIVSTGHNRLILSQTGRDVLFLVPLKQDRFLVEGTTADLITFDEDGLVWKPRRAMAARARRLK